MQLHPKFDVRLKWSIISYPARYLYRRKQSDCDFGTQIRPGFLLSGDEKSRDVHQTCLKRVGLCPIDQEESVSSEPSMAGPLPKTLHRLGKN